MRRLVVDASVAGHLLLNQHLQAEARLLLETFNAGAVDLTAPDVINYEVGNLLRTAVLKEALTEVEAGSAYAGFLQFAIGEAEMNQTDLEEALALSIRKRLSLYDGAYIQLSKSLSAVLITSDEKQLEAARGEVSALHLRDIADILT